MNELNKTALKYKILETVYKIWAEASYDGKKTLGTLIIPANTTPFPEELSKYTRIPRNIGSKSGVDVFYDLETQSFTATYNPAVLFECKDDAPVFQNCSPVIFREALFPSGSTLKNPYCYDVFLYQKHRRVKLNILQKNRLQSVCDDNIFCKGDERFLIVRKQIKDLDPRGLKNDVFSDIYGLEWILPDTKESFCKLWKMMDSISQTCKMVSLSRLFVADGHYVEEPIVEYFKNDEAKIKDLTFEMKQWASDVPDSHLTKAVVSEMNITPLFRTHQQFQDHILNPLRSIQSKIQEIVTEHQEDILNYIREYHTFNPSEKQYQYGIFCTFSQSYGFCQYPYELLLSYSSEESRQLIDDSGRICIDWGKIQPHDIKAAWKYICRMISCSDIEMYNFPCFCRSI